MSPSSHSRRAVIDIGTNSVKLLVGDVSGSSVLPIYENNQLTRLGKGLYDTGRLSPDSILSTVDAASRFAEKANDKGTGQIRIIATSATRDASNSSELLTAIENATGVKPEIISGKHEASLVLKGILTLPQFKSRPMLITDIGGGSTELILTQDSQLLFENSYQLGTVRLTEAAPPLDPPTNDCRKKTDSLIENVCLDEITPKLLPLIKELDSPLLVTTGGTSSILARIHTGTENFDRDEIERTSLSAKQVSDITDQLWGCPLAERQTIPGLPANRADVMPAGAAIYVKLFQHLGFRSMQASTRGLRFGALL